MTDERLLERLSADDALALRMLMERHWPAMIAYLARHVGTSGDAAIDCAQEAFCRLWERRSTWKPAGSVRGLLCRLARNAAISEHRRWRARDCATRASVAKTDVYEPPSFAPEREELRRELERGIAALPRRRREVFLLRRVHGLSHRQIAKRMGTSTQTVANQLSHALSTLRRELAHLRA
ncbi:MAG: RNA polymerase sigma factor [Gemmatimonadota bacterium]